MPPGLQNLDDRVRSLEFPRPALQPSRKAGAVLALNQRDTPICAVDALGELGFCHCLTLMGKGHNMQLSRRRAVLFGLGATMLSAPLASLAHAQAIGSTLNGLLGQAVDGALDRLSKPGAFYNDEAVRIALPVVGGTGGLLGSAMKVGRKFGVLDTFTRQLNDAAGKAAGEAKPLFRTAISDLSFTDVPGIVSQPDGGTRYLRSSAGDELETKLRPLVDSALGDLGAFKQLDKLTARTGVLAASGISREGLGKSVASQALNGIFKYIGSEEASLRSDPLGKAGSLLKGILGN